MQKVFIDRTGEVFGRLTALKCTQKCNKAKGVSSTKYLCECECGNTKEVAVNSLVSGATKSCGCLTKEITTKLMTKHGATVGGIKNPTYESWRGMKERCSYEGHKSYEKYGGSGIEVCKEWVNSFSTFLSDMGERPDAKTLDRIDPNLGYYKDNCRWATHSTQAYNIHKESGGTSSRVGISWHKKIGKWQVRLTLDYKEHHIGYFDNEEDAIKAREDAEVYYRGENLK